MHHQKTQRSSHITLVDTDTLRACLPNAKLNSQIVAILDVYQANRWLSLGWLGKLLVRRVKLTSKEWRTMATKAGVVCLARLRPGHMLVPPPNGRRLGFLRSVGSFKNRSESNREASSPKACVLKCSCRCWHHQPVALAERLAAELDIVREESHGGCERSQARRLVPDAVEAGACLVVD